MSSIGIELSLAKLAKLINSIDAVSSQLNSKAVRFYPADYQELDSDSAGLLQAKSFLSTVYNQQSVNLGVVGLRTQVTYYKQRLTQLESFYSIATASDQPEISNSIRSILDNIAECNYRRILALHQKITLEIPKHYSQLLQTHGLI